MSHLKPGDKVPGNAYTSFDTLGQLIGRFNRIAAKRFLAHGRVWSDIAGPTLHLLKFSKPKGAVAQVEFSEVMSIEYLNVQTRRVHTEIMKVATVLPNRPKKKRTRSRVT